MRNLFYIVVILVISGCTYAGSQINHRLNEVSGLLQTDPEAAMKQLNSFDVAEFNDSATMAHWALLYSEALVANRISAPTDTIVNIAIDYYSRHNQADELKKASRLKALLSASGDNNELATALYLQKEKEYFLYKERAKRNLLTLSTLLILILALGIIIWMCQRIRLQKLRNENLIAEASGLRNVIESNSENVDRLEKKLYGLLENRFSLIDSLCQTYYESQGTKIEKKAIIDKVKSEIDLLRNDSFAEMEQAVNDCRDNILNKIQELYPAIKPDDYRLLVYLACGLSTRTISLLIGESVDVIYKRKSRLKSRLKTAVEPDCPMVMSVF